jgi:DNA-directed RNA polymerase subunit omega
MLHPSYSELMEVVNSDVEEGEQLVVQSRYSIVKATAERAKQIIDARYLNEKIEKAKVAENSKEGGRGGEIRLTADEKRKCAIGQELIENSENMKPLSVAVKELYEGKIKIVTQD